MTTNTEDFIVFEARAVPVHQRHIILHELGHLLWGHEHSVVTAEDATKLLLPSLDPTMVKRALGREHSSSEAEQEAELLASLIGERISSWTTEQTWTVPPEATELIRRIEISMGINSADRGTS